MTNEVLILGHRAISIFPATNLDIGEEFDPKVELRCGMSVTSSSRGEFKLEFILLDGTNDPIGLPFNERSVDIDNRFATYLQEVTRRSDAQLFYPLNLRALYNGCVKNTEHEEAVYLHYHIRNWTAHFVAHHFDFSASIRESRKNNDIIRAQIISTLRLNGEQRKFNFHFSLDREIEEFSGLDFADQYLGLMPPIKV